MRKYFVVISIILLSFFGVLKPLQLASLNLFSGSILYLRTLSYDVNDVLIFYSNVENIRQENIRLREKLNQIETQNALKINNEILNNEVLDLQNFFKEDRFFDDKKIDFLRVIFYDAFSSRIYLDIGDRQVEIGDEVLYGRNLVGVVYGVSSDIVEVKLLSDRDFILNTIVVTRNKEKVKTVLSGEIGDSLVIKNILSTESVSEGDLVYTANTNQNILPELIVGRVERLEGITSQTFRKASLIKFYDLNYINYLGVLSDD